jgi:hypothetical protein
MYKALVVVFVCFFLSGDVLAQTSEDSVKVAVQNLFDAMRNSDSNALVNCFSDSAIMQTIAKDKSGATVVKTEKIVDFAIAVKFASKGSLDERISFDIVKIDGPLAIVWTPYKFYFGGNFHHCGVNSFHLVRSRSGWKIQYIIDTRRTQGCE